MIIQQGPLKGVEGLLVQDAVQASDARLVVSVSLLQRSVAVEVDREWIARVRSIRILPWAESEKALSHR